tara:strand:+ start:726 stop:1118 length:393 start_codon:yes stop_codon:yes gene_type:complete
MKKTFNSLVEESRDSLEIIDSHTLKDLIDKNEDLSIIDVNDKEDVDSRGMIEGAFNVSLGTLHYKADQEVPESFKDDRIQDRNKKVVVTCGLGLCAAIAGKLLKDMGFKDVALLDGGVEKWVEDGYKLEK